MTRAITDHEGPDRTERKWKKLLFKLCARAVWLGTGEWILTRDPARPNGGTVVLARAIWTTTVVYLSAIGMHELIDPSATRSFSILELRKLLLKTAPLLGTIFAGVYFSLYARFSSQWTYLANVYNQIKGAEVRLNEKSPLPAGLKALAEWKAGFIEDALTLHLAAKPLFGSTIVAWIADTEVERAFCAHTANADLTDLKAAIATFRAATRISSHAAVTASSEESMLPTSKAMG